MAAAIRLLTEFWSRVVGCMYDLSRGSVSSGTPEADAVAEGEGEKSGR